MVMVIVIISLFIYGRHGNRAVVCGRAVGPHRHPHAIRSQRQAATSYDVITSVSGISASGSDRVSVRRHGSRSTQLAGEVWRLSNAPAGDGLQVSTASSSASAAGGFCRRAVIRQSVRRRRTTKRRGTNVAVTERRTTTETDVEPLRVYASACCQGRLDQLATFVMT